MVSTAKVRRILLGAVLAMGVGLMGFSAHGLVSLDTELSNAAQRSVPERSVPVTDDDCPHKRDRPARGSDIEA